MNFRIVCIMSLPLSALWDPRRGGFYSSQPPKILRHDIPVPEDIFSAIK